MNFSEAILWNFWQGIGFGTTAIIFAKTGFTVYGFDVNKNVINTLKSGHIHIVEPDLQEAFKKVLDDNKLIPIEKLEKSDVFVSSYRTGALKRLGLDYESLH